MSHSVLLDNPVVKALLKRLLKKKKVTPYLDQIGKNTLNVGSCAKKVVERLD